MGYGGGGEGGGSPSSSSQHSSSAAMLQRRLPAWRVFEAVEEAESKVGGPPFLPPSFPPYSSPVETHAGLTGNNPNQLFQNKTHHNAFMQVATILAHRRDRPKLCIRVARARALLGKDRQGSSSPYAILTLGACVRAYVRWVRVLCVCVCVCVCARPSVCPSVRPSVCSRVQPRPPPHPARNHSTQAAPWPARACSGGRWRPSGARSSSSTSPRPTTPPRC